MKRSFFSAFLAFALALTLVTPALASCTHGSGGTCDVEDTFSRSFSPGWDAADTGGTWAHTDANGSNADGTAGVDSFEGYKSITTTSTAKLIASQVGIGTGVDERLVTVTAGHGLSGAATGIVFRMYDHNSYYTMTLDNNSFDFRKNVDGTWTTLSTVGASPSYSTSYYIRVQSVGSAIKGKYWQVGTSEPGSWTIDTTDSTYNDGTVAEVGRGEGVFAEVTGTSQSTTFNYDDYYLWVCMGEVCGGGDGSWMS